MQVRANRRPGLICAGQSECYDPCTCIPTFSNFSTRGAGSSPILGLPGLDLPVMQVRRATGVISGNSSDNTKNQDERAAVPHAGMTHWPMTNGTDERDLVEIRLALKQTKVKLLVREPSQKEGTKNLRFTTAQRTRYCFKIQKSDDQVFLRKSLRASIRLLPDYTVGGVGPRIFLDSVEDWRRCVLK